MKQVCLAFLFCVSAPIVGADQSDRWVSRARFPVDAITLSDTRICLSNGECRVLPSPRRVTLLRVWSGRAEVLYQGDIWSVDKASVAILRDGCRAPLDIVIASGSCQ